MICVVNLLQNYTLYQEKRKLLRKNNMKRVKKRKVLRIKYIRRTFR